MVKIKEGYELLMKGIETLTGIDNKIEMTVCLKNYGLTLNLALEAEGLGEVLNSTVKLISHLLMKPEFNKIFEEFEEVIEDKEET